MIFKNSVNIKVFRILVYVCIFFACLGQSTLPSSIDEARVAIAANRTAIRNEKCIKNGSWLLAFGIAKPGLDSSSSHRAAVAAARMDALGNIVQSQVLERIRDGLGALPPAVHSSVTGVIVRNYSGKIKLDSLQILEQGEDKTGVWVYLAVPITGVFQKDLPRSVTECLAGIALGPENVIKPTESDYFYEAALICGVPDAKAAWIRSYPDLLKPQLSRQPVQNGIRFWVDHRTEVMSVLADLKTPSDIKKAMVALPYCKNLFDLLSSALSAQGLEHVANEFKNIEPAISCSAIDKVNDADLEKEIASIGAVDNLAIKLIVAFDGKFPEKGEESKRSYDEALAAYTKSEFSVAIPLCLKAVSEAYNANTINLLGATARQCGLNRLGVILCRQAFFIDPLHPYASANVALCYERLGERKLAEEYARRAISTGISNQWSKDQADRILNKSK